MLRRRESSSAACGAARPRGAAAAIVIVIAWALLAPDHARAQDAVDPPASARAGTDAAREASLLALAPVACVQAFDGFAAEPWPGFRPREVPLAIFDGERTWLVRHPGPPEAYARLDAIWAVREGRDPSVVANTSEVLGGVVTATLIADRGSRSAAADAALLVHESFHVFQDLALPGWTANEAEQFAYPFDDGAALAGRRLETHCLREAMLALVDGDESSAFAHAAAALAFRADRFAVLPDGASAYERGLELREGLAQYLQYRAFDERPATPIPAAGYPSEALRKRVYDVGEAWGRLLDRAAPGWQDEVPADGSRAPDELLQQALSRRGVVPRVPSASESAPIVARARADAAAVAASRVVEREAYLQREGWTLTLDASADPLQVQGFDPLNVRPLDGGHVLHTRMLRLRAGAGRVELDDASLLTHGAGSHPLFSGVDRLTAAGLPERPLVVSEAGVLAVIAGGLVLELRGATIEIDEAARALRISL